MIVANGYRPLTWEQARALRLVQDYVTLFPCEAGDIASLVTDRSPRQSKSEPWLQIKVKESVLGAQIRSLDDHLAQSLNFLVERDPASGKYARAADGTYTVRVMFASDSAVHLAKTIIEDNGFEVVSEVTHES